MALLLSLPLAGYQGAALLAECVAAKAYDLAREQRVESVGAGAKKMFTG